MRSVMNAYFHSLHRDEKAMEARRLAAIPLFKHGLSLSSIARQIGVSRQAVSVWHKQFRRHGRVGLRRRQRPGRPPDLTSSECGQISRWLARRANAFGSSSPSLTTERIEDMLFADFAVNYGPENLHWQLNRLGFVHNTDYAWICGGWVPIEFKRLVDLIAECVLKEPYFSDLEVGRGALEAAGRRLGYELGEGSNGVDLFWLVHGKRRFAWQVHDGPDVDESRSRKLRKAKALFRFILHLNKYDSGIVYGIRTFRDERRRF